MLSLAAGAGAVKLNNFNSNPEGRKFTFGLQKSRWWTCYG